MVGTEKFRALAVGKTLGLLVMISGEFDVLYIREVLGVPVIGTDEFKAL